MLYFHRLLKTADGEQRKEAVRRLVLKVTVYPEVVEVETGILVPDGSGGALPVATKTFVI